MTTFTTLTLIALAVLFGAKWLHVRHHDPNRVQKRKTKFYDQRDAKRGAHRYRSEKP